MNVILEGVPEAIDQLNKVDNGMRAGMRRALFRIGSVVKRTAVDYAPISPSSTMLKAFSKSIKKGGSNANVMYVAGRKGRGGTAVKLTAFYEHRLGMLTAKGSNTRPMPGGLMRSIQFASADDKVEIFVPVNSPAGHYATKIHDEKGSAWKERGPGTQAKGPQADDKFILRAVNYNRNNILTILKEQIDKILGGKAI